MADKNVKLKDGSSYLFPQTKVANIIDLNSSSDLTTKTIDTQIKYATTEPAAAATGGLRFAVLDGEPTTYRNGWFYIDNSNEPVGYSGLCFTANTAGSTVELCKVGSPSITNTAYSRDGETWTAFSPSASSGTNKITLANAGDKVYFRNNITGNFGEDKYLHFVMSGSIAASGNINSLYNVTTFEDLTTLTYKYCFYALFDSCTSLTTPPELPATTLSNSCYGGLFNACSGLTTVPELPATNLNEACYVFMFFGCESIETPPVLQATNLAPLCYYAMFANCTSLTTVPNLPAKELKEYCYAEMFSYCTSLYVSDTSTSAASCGWRIPTSGTFTNKTKYDQDYMFSGCLGTRSSNTMSGGSGQSHTYYTQNAPI